MTDHNRLFNIGKIAVYAFLIVLSIFYLVPIYTMINVSLKSSRELIWGPILLPKHIFLGTYAKAYERVARPLLNTIIIAGTATIGAAFLGSMSGYVFSKFKFKGVDIVFFLIVLGFYMPPQPILIPLVRFMGRIHLYDTRAGLILTHIAYGMPIVTLMARNYYKSIPTGVLESAFIDGCSIPGAFFRIMLPLSLPGLAVIGIFEFTNAWNDYLFALVLTRGIDAQPITLAVANLSGTRAVTRNIQMAGVAIASIPLIVVYIFLLRLIVKGLILGSVKE